MATVAAASLISSPLRSSSLPKSLCCRRWGSIWGPKEGIGMACYLMFPKNCGTRRTAICAVNQDAEKSFKKTVEVDHLIDMLKVANAREERIESATDVLKAILNPVVDDVEEISWPPRDPEALTLMEKELEKREQEGQLDEGFLSEVNAQLRQAKEDGDKPGLEAMLQKVLQIYASKVLRKRSYVYKGGKVLAAEKFLETVIEAPEDHWNKLLIEGLNIGKGEVAPEEFYAVIKKRIERVLIRTEGGSYQQRVLVEYLRGIQSRAEEIVQALGGPHP
ncbi:hypothetical protein MUK42_11092 [Musa troglodytarum]|uniref:Uncharacterized protein n=1 Tax=Musa troglodytarum TaxID=320322 RepID=A0A9E7GN49_9LILI|nr:hypothetical protein MUK42_11092 [Musa troglodytarum]